MPSHCLYFDVTQDEHQAHDIYVTRTWSVGGDQLGGGVTTNTIYFTQVSFGRKVSNRIYIVANAAVHDTHKEISEAVYNYAHKGVPLPPDLGDPEEWSVTGQGAPKKVFSTMKRRIRVRRRR